ncbi:MAG TPA: type II toxin-antitoxin system PemK/MazF family toxin [Candidatus Binatia bacterium]
MPSSLKNDIVLVRYPFSDLSGAKVRPAVVVSAPHVSEDIFLVPLTSRVASLLPGEFLLVDWTRAGLNVPTAAKRGLYTIHQDLVVRTVGKLSQRDAERLHRSLQVWLGFS